MQDLQQNELQASLTEGIVKLNNHDYSGAENYFLEKFNANPSYQAAYYLSVSLLCLDKIQEFELYLEKYINLYEKNNAENDNRLSPSPLYHMARIYDTAGLYCLEKRNFEKAEVLLTRAISFDPLFFSPLHNLGLLKYPEHPKDAVEILNRALLLAHSPHDKACVLLTLGNCADYHHDYQTACHHYEKALSYSMPADDIDTIIKSNYMSTLNSQGHVFYQDEDYLNAELYYHSAAILFSQAPAKSLLEEHLVSLNQLGMCKYKQQEYNSAKDFFNLFINKSYKYNIPNADGWINRADCLEKLGESALASGALQTAEKQFTLTPDDAALVSDKYKNICAAHIQKAIRIYNSNNNFIFFK